jgi:uroporphyrin-III C-methyltransferase/precorrin-2 dehydrogenase/sirohydrochlorin ferrochelatase
MFPVMLSLEKRPCLVVGGGGVALRKTQSLVAEQAVVTLVAPELVEPLQELGRAGRIAVERREYRPGEAAGYALVFAATDDREVNRRVFRDAEEAGVWVNVADDPELCSFHLPARVQRGALQLAVASGGEAPFVVRRLRQLLEARFGPEWSEWAEAAARFRELVRSGLPPGPEQEEAFDRFFKESVDAGRLRARVPGAAEQRSWIGREESGGGPAPSRADGRPPEGPAAEGLVSLVGAGPGCPGLLTLRGRERLLGADAVVYDRLAATALPCELPARVELHPVGKLPGHHPVPQEEINALLVRLAREGKRVVRLKGGDPFVFGRGGEEGEALAAEGLRFEVVPGVTSGVAAPAFLGIPVTHRKEAVRLTLLTAHEAVKESGRQVRWDLLAQDPHATLVGYMGVTALPRVVEELLKGTMDPKTPAAMVECGTLARQRSVIAPLAELPEAVERAGLAPPALFVIGPTVAHADQLDWRRAQPLAGERLLAPEADPATARALEEAGAEVLAVSLPLRPAARVVVGAAPLTGCLLSRPTQVDSLEEERDGAGWEGEVVAWCRGPETAARARRYGWRRVEELEAGEEGALLAARLRSRRARES